MKLSVELKCGYSVQRYILAVDDVLLGKVALYTQQTYVRLVGLVLGLGQLSLPSLQGRYMSTSFSWEGKGRYGSFC